MLLEPFPIAELNAVVERDRFLFLPGNAAEVCNGKVSQQPCIHLRHKERHEISAPAVDKGYDAHPFVPAHERVTLEIADSSSTLDNGRPLINAPLFGFFSRFLLLFGMSPPAVFAFL